MHLRYKHEAGAYFGSRYRVEQSALVRQLKVLLDGGWGPEAAFDAVLDEGSWLPDMPGVRLLVASPCCLYCGEGLLRGRRTFCNVVCEAAAFVAVSAAIRRPE